MVQRYFHFFRRQRYRVDIPAVRLQLFAANDRIEIRDAENGYICQLFMNGCKAVGAEHGQTNVLRT